MNVAIVRIFFGGRMSNEQRYRLNRLAATLVTQERFGAW